MGRGSNGARSTRPANSMGKQEESEYQKRESSLKYSYDPEKVKFQTRVLDLGGFTDADMGSRDNFHLGVIQRNSKTGKFHLDDEEWYDSASNATLKSMINKAVKAAKNAYKNNENIRDAIYRIDNDDYDSKYSVDVSASLVANNRVKILVSRLKTR